MIFSYVESIKKFASPVLQGWLFWASLFAFLMLRVVPQFFAIVKSPVNYMMILRLFTLLDGFFFGAITASHKIDSIWIAIAITIGLTLAITVVAFVTPCNFPKIVLFCQVFLFGLSSFFLMIYLDSSRTPNEWTIVFGM